MLQYFHGSDQEKIFYVLVAFNQKAPIDTIQRYCEFRCNHIMTSEIKLIKCANISLIKDATSKVVRARTLNNSFSNSMQQSIIF